ncbi:hypothetical protein [Hymenobacter sp. ISL-91]|uniref:hypothetical protein n=1 Tax=Hymenobacter sp. ISL-91 TaxID=2819151 RepID=UPI001BE9C419|nr:hypothetical protein [Hymenobacter sp. ISL-91]
MPERVKVRPKPNLDRQLQVSVGILGQYLLLIIRFLGKIFFSVLDEALCLETEPIGPEKRITIH